MMLVLLAQTLGVMMLIYVGVQVAFALFTALPPHPPTGQDSRPG